MLAEMADQERELTEEERLEKEIADYKERLKQEASKNKQLLKEQTELLKEQTELVEEQTEVLNREISRRKFLLAAGAVVGVAAGGVGGLLYGRGEGRGQFLDPGELTPELEALLLGAKNDIHITDGVVTGQTLSDGGMDFSISPELERSAALTTPSKHKWLAFRPDYMYRRPSKEGATLKDLMDSITSTSFTTSLSRTVEGELGKDRFKDVKVVQPEVVDFLAIEYTLNARGETLFTQEGIILTSTTFTDAEGVKHGLGIGREAVDGQLGLILIDLATEAPVPANLSAGGFVVAK